MPTLYRKEGGDKARGHLQPASLWGAGEGGEGSLGQNPIFCWKGLQRAVGELKRSLHGEGHGHPAQPRPGPQGWEPSHLNTVASTVGFDSFF